MNVKEAVALAAHVVSKGQAPIPVLAYMRIANGRIIATDTTQQIDIPEALPGLGKADFCVHAARFLRALSALPPELELSLEHKAKKLHIKAGATRYELNTLPAEDYPTMSQADEKPVRFEVESKKLVSALKFVRAAMATSDIRYYLNGVHYQLAKGRLVLTATDGHRLHREGLDVTTAAEADKAHGILAAASVGRVIEVAERHSTVSIDASATRFNVEDKEVLQTKLIDGQFPDADRVIPHGRASTGAIQRAPFLAAVKRVAQIVAGEKITAIRFKFTREEIVLEANNTEKDLAEERFGWHAADQAFAGLEVGLDAAYIAAAFESLSGDHVFAYLTSTPGDSFYLTDGGAREVVIMPMRV